MAICVRCGQARRDEDIQDGLCIYCRNIDDLELDDDAVDHDRRMLSRDRSASVPVASVDKAAVRDVVLTTAFDIPGRRIGQVIEIVGAEVAVGMSIFKDIANAWRDTFGGRSNSVQNTLREARTQCLVELRREAFRLDADGVIAVRFCYNEASVATGTGGGILIVSATGTAVKLAG